MGNQIRNQIVKRTLGHYASLLEHATRDYEVSPRHVLRRIVQPLCEDFADIIKNGNKNDYAQIIEGFSKRCISFEIENKSD